MGSWGKKDARKGSGWRTRWARRWLADWRVPQLCTDKPEGTIGEGDRLSNPDFQFREIKPQNL